MSDLHRPPAPPPAARSALEEVSGLAGEREPGLTGVWVRGGKVAALGVRASRWVSYHGLALNVATDLAGFDAVVPCGLEGRRVASVEGLLLEAAAAADPYAPPAALAAALAGDARPDGGGADSSRYGAFTPVAQAGDLVTPELVAALNAGLDAEERAAAAARAALLLEYRHALDEALEAELGFEIARTVVGDAAVAELNALAPAAPAAGSAAAAAGVPAAPPGGDVVPLPCSDS
jgi:hypothetical protein